MTTSYRYRAIDMTGRVVTGQAKAVNREDLSRHLLKQKLYLISVSTQTSYVDNFHAWRLTGVSFALQEFCFQLHLLLQTGIPLPHALENLQHQNSLKPLSGILEQLAHSLQSGKLLSEALEDFPTIFNCIFVNLVRMGERAGDLSTSFQQILTYLEWQQQIKQQVFRALFYPLLLGSVITGLISILMIMVIPQLQHFLEAYHHGLPLMTRLLMMTAHTVEMAAFPFFVMMSTSIMFFLLLRRVSLPLRILSDRAKLCWPLLGQLFLLVEAERFVYTLRILITAGVPLLECLQYAQDSIKNTWLRQQLKDVRHHIERGDSFSIALKKKQIFMGLLTDLIAIGEQTGELEKGLVRAHHFLMQTLKRRLNTMMAFIEPLLILCLGSLLIWIAVAIFMPLYDHMEQTL